MRNALRWIRELKGEKKKSSDSRIRPFRIQSDSTSRCFSILFFSRPWFGFFFSFQGLLGAFYISFDASGCYQRGLAVIIRRASAGLFGLYHCIYSYPPLSLFLVFFDIFFLFGRLWKPIPLAVRDAHFHNTCCINSRMIYEKKLTQPGRRRKSAEDETNCFFNTNNVQSGMM